MSARALFAYFALRTLQQWLAPLLALAPASMIYVSVADLLSGLHRRPEINAIVPQVLLIIAGIASIWGVCALMCE